MRESNQGQDDEANEYAGPPIKRVKRESSREGDASVMMSCSEPGEASKADNNVLKSDGKSMHDEYIYILTLTTDQS